MPNTGRPSLDCHLCRQRRVKCDLARPACQRCTKYGAVCPGYRDQQALVFRNADPSTLKRRHGKKRNAVGASAASSSSEASAAAETSGVLVTRPGFVDAPPLMTLGRQVTEHWTAQSVPLLLDVYSTMDFLRAAYATASRGGPLLWAAHVFAGTYVTNVRYPTEVACARRAESRRELAVYMGKALRAVNRALAAPGGACRDDILAAVWVLANHEVLAGTLGRQQPVNAWQLHARGLYVILQARGSAPLRTAAGRTAFWPAFNIVQLQALILNTACPAETDEWLGICESGLFEGEELTLRIAQYVARVCDVQSRVMRHLRGADFRGASDDYLDLRQALLDADETFAEYLRNAVPPAPEACCHQHPNKTMDVYMRNVRCAAVIRSHHQMQMLCNLLTHYAPCPVSLDELLAHRRSSLQRVNESAQAVIDSLPAAMAPLMRTTVLKSPHVLFDAMKLVFPLFLVAHVPSTPQEHKDVALRALVFIGKEVGIRQALMGDGPTMPLPAEARVPFTMDLMAEPPWVSTPPRDYTVLGF
ncbi:Fungal transcriptional regulatory protein [Cordyceps fumosorosea ARSEF 2679]|uniref:Fungal transcriptional regulatory protein n=1 Tax=Cordyceps fumosorosea (strain ARSEF 2679) TaxID=1081104 RepID=A0A167XFS8_CORFA|nr:Fungal transcriptional regulatory protein [Cordyceps fumosorosea ARSEF 2679]OAA64927.1 Fungal transcriptional regulatory protein [Cordyceps fumosorosea ARSEF 2679]